MKISVVVNTFNEEKNISRCLESVKNFANELIVVDMHSTDKTVEMAKKYGVKVFQHDYTRYVEPARNFALTKAGGDWILVIDADEELPLTLAEKLKGIAQENKVDYVEIPRKNIIFGKWIKHSFWWPDYNVRFFKKGMVIWGEKIHSRPMVHGKGSRLEAKEEQALIHYNYQTISQYLERNNRYSEIKAEELVKEDYHFSLQDLVKKPADEFLSRFFAGEGYKDGLHGLSLAILQSFVEFLIYLKVWEKEGFRQTEVKSFPKLFQKSLKDYFHWQAKKSSFFAKIRLKVKSIL